MKKLSMFSVFLLLAFLTSFSMAHHQSTISNSEGISSTQNIQEDFLPLLDYAINTLAPMLLLDIDPEVQEQLTEVQDKLVEAKTMAEESSMNEDENKDEKMSVSIVLKGGVNEENLELINSMIETFDGHVSHVEIEIEDSRDNYFDSPPEFIYDDYYNPKMDLQYDYEYDDHYGPSEMTLDQDLEMAKEMLNSFVDEAKASGNEIPQESIDEMLVLIGESQTAFENGDEEKAEELAFEAMEIYDTDLMGHMDWFKGKFDENNPDYMDEYMGYSNDYYPPPEYWEDDYPNPEDWEKDYYGEHENYREPPILPAYNEEYYNDWKNGNFPDYYERDHPQPPEYYDGEWDGNYPQPPEYYDGEWDGNYPQPPEYTEGDYPYPEPWNNGQPGVDGWEGSYDDYPEDEQYEGYYEGHPDPEDWEGDYPESPDEESGDDYTNPEDYETDYSGGYDQPHEADSPAESDSSDDDSSEDTINPE